MSDLTEEEVAEFEPTEFFDGASEADVLWWKYLFYESTRVHDGRDDLMTEQLDDSVLAGQFEACTGYRAHLTRAHRDVSSVTNNLESIMAELADLSRRRVYDFREILDTEDEVRLIDYIRDPFDLPALLEEVAPVVRGQVLGQDQVRWELDGKQWTYSPVHFPTLAFLDQRPQGRSTDGGPQ